MHAGMPRITAAMTVEDLLDRFPSAIPVFVSRRMQCIGCPVARFETVAEACAIYRMDTEHFIAEIAAIIGSDGGAGECRKK